MQHNHNCLAPAPERSTLPRSPRRRPFSSWTFARKRAIIICEPNPAYKRNTTTQQQSSYNSLQDFYHEETETQPPQIRQEDRPAPKTVNQYLARVPQPARAHLNKMRAAIRSAVPKDSLEIISYGIPAFKQKRILVWYAAFSNHCSLFPTAAIIDKFKNHLKPFSTSKGTIHFPTDKPLPTALIKKLVKARVAQAASKKSPT